MGTLPGKFGWRRPATRADLDHLYHRFERLLMTTAQDVIDGFVQRLDTATDVLAQDFKAATQRVLDALAGQDPALQAQVQAALNAGFEGPIATLEAMGKDNANPIPDPSPSPTPAPVPDPNQPTPGPVDPDNPPADGPTDPNAPVDPDAPAQSKRKR